MDISDIVIELCTVIFLALGAAVAVTVAWMTRKHYRQKNVYDQWMVALSHDYHKQNMQVVELIEKRCKDELSKVDMIKEINDDQKIKQAVNYVLDYWEVKGTSAKFKIIDRNLAIPMAYREIVYYFEGLLPWILYKRGHLLSMKGDSISDKEMLLGYLMNDLDIKPAKNVKISKSDDGKTIRISDDKLEIGSIRIDEENEKACLKISGGGDYDLAVEKKEGKLNIYKIEKYYHRCAYMGFEWLYDYCMDDSEKMC